ncbi:probable protein phosphatase 2C 33 [Gastrolobium bilobum]|uniref:probable protein phosphatase 2C 33 n=1 Tax=Gastrolobium bilobum TaxID=150636 RepID=UPI002AAFF3C4|nr:probable protein phosphatase 2C 33 [Gastrolobium bilobum]
MGSCLSASPSSDPSSSSSSSQLSYDYSMEMRLHRVPGRLFLNGSSQVASLFCKQGRKGINQDAVLLWENFCSKEDTIFCGVFDGHGPYGHMVAKKVRDSLPLKLIAQLDLHPNNKDPTTATLTESFLKACKLIDKELKLHHLIHCYCSGTTAVTLVKQGHDLVIANVGDSRAVLGTRDHEDSLIPVQLTTDLKPNLPREAERIRLCKGRVFALENEPQVARVWLPNVDSPGLAMARTFGDFCLKEFGVISVPDVSYHRLTEKDEFVVLATDGVWDVLSNKEVVGIVASVPRSSAARILVESAVQAWMTKLPTSKVDDCSVVCLFFDSNSDFKSQRKNLMIGGVKPEQKQQ